MHDYDAEQVWDFEISSHDYLDESYTHVHDYTWELDDEYGRDSTDYQQLAYQHYCWYTGVTALYDIIPYIHFRIIYYVTEILLSSITF